MIRINVELKSNGNAAFEDQPEQEVSRILIEAAQKIAEGHTDFRLNDINGNKCGEVCSLKWRDLPAGEES